MNARLDLAPRKTTHGVFVNRAGFRERRDQRGANAGEFVSHKDASIPQHVCHREPPASSSNPFCRFQSTPREYGAIANFMCQRDRLPRRVKSNAVRARNRSGACR